MKTSLRTTGYLYPWDVIDDSGAAERIAGVGLDSITLAAAYHGVRAVTPVHPRHRFVEARHSALYVPVRPEAWESAPIRLASAQSWTGRPDSFGEAKRRLTEAGVSVDAWVVLTHRDPAEGGPDYATEYCVRNAFGDRYRYALCPSQSAVVDYARRLVAEVLTLGQPAGLAIEACGPLGFKHGHLHDKSAMEGMSGLEEALLSFCFCPACSEGLAALGVDAVQLAARVRQVVRERLPDSQVNDGSPTPVEDALGPEAEALYAVRLSSISRLWEQVLDQIADFGELRVAFHASPGRWRTGAESALPVDVLQRRPARLIVPCGDDMQAGLARIDRVRQRTSAPVAANVSVLQDAASSPVAISGATLVERWRQLLAAGVDELQIYHLGLASPARFRAVAEALADPALARVAAG
ncbi:MAG TPA: hypothetical protein VLL08_21440 [Kineosporiaceae bacterium]|nr:hypothetical protein [Kineosporiaceae bacterium]